MTTPIYQNTECSIDERVTDLLSRMTLREKIGQMMQLSGQEDHFGPVDQTIRDYTPGSILHAQGDDAAMAIRTALEDTRLGIPLLMADDAIHGHSFWPGATIFPTQLTMGCSWNPELLKDVARATAREMRPTGLTWTFSPVLCLARDLRWGRISETFGEDPCLIGDLALAMVNGYQGDGLDDPEAVLATAKHFAGYSETQGGRDASEADLSRRKLRSYFLPPFERVARGGCLAFMTGYQSMEGVPSTANRWLLTEVLKNEWWFSGILVTDWNNVGHLVHAQKVCADFAEAATVAVKAGNDMIMHTPEFMDGAISAVEAGQLEESEIDDSVARILSLKFKLGLFENPGYPNTEQQRLVMGNSEHAALNLKAARQSLVLLRNNNVLPLDCSVSRTMAVIGPNADNDLAQLGDWSLGSGQTVNQGYSKHPRTCTTTVLDGLRELAHENLNVEYSQGAEINKPADPGKVEEAARLSREADVSVVVVGDDLDFIGEGKSTATLELQGGQLSLLQALAETGTPLIVVLVQSKPLVLPSTVTEAAALLCAFNPGMQGGRAIAEAIYGHLNPSGKLNISFPRHVGQQPVFYSQVRGQHGKRYADLTQEPLFPFGFGLSYTRFEYSALKVETPVLRCGETARFSVTVSNRGDCEGVEITQLYVSDLITSCTWVNKELKAYARTSLAAGESKRLLFELDTSKLSLVNSAGERVVEAGEFAVMVGGSSRDQDLLKDTFDLTSGDSGS